MKFAEKSEKEALLLKVAPSFIFKLIGKLNYYV